MKKNIRISRYTSQDAAIPGAACADGVFRWDASVEPEDGSWILFVPTTEAMVEGMTPQLWHRIDVTVEGHESEAVYALEGSDEHKAYLDAMPKVA